MTSLRVATCNVRNGRAIDGWHSWWFRRWALLHVLQDLDADVLALQEVHRFQRRWLEGRLPGRRFLGAGRDDGRRGEHCPVVVRDLAVIDHRTRWFGATPGVPGTRLEGAHFPRIATTVTLEAGGRRFQVTSTHLDERSQRRREQAMAQLLGWLDWGVPQVVLGDLNADPDDPVLHLAEEAGLRQALPTDAGGTAHQFTGRTDGRRIDHVLVSEHVRVEQARVVTLPTGRRLISDHWPVVADLELPTAEG